MPVDDLLPLPLVITEGATMNPCLMVQVWIEVSLDSGPVVLIGQVVLSLASLLLCLEYISAYLAPPTLWPTFIDVESGCFWRVCRIWDRVWCWRNGFYSSVLTQCWSCGVDQGCNSIHLKMSRKLSQNHPKSPIWKGDMCQLLISWIFYINFLRGFLWHFSWCFSWHF